MGTRLEAWGVRLGFNYVARLGPAGRAACEAAVDAGATGSIGEFWRHTGLTRPPMEQLVRCGAFDRVHPGRTRRELLWELVGVEGSLPPRRRAGAGNRPAAAPGPPRGRGHVTAAPAAAVPPLGPLLDLPAPAPELPPMSERDRVAADYAVHGVSTGPHLVSLLRPSLDALGCVPLARVAQLRDGSRITVAGLVIARQAPVSAKGFRFFTLADEGAHLDLIFRPEVARRTRAVANASPLLLAEGTLEGDGHPSTAAPRDALPEWPSASHDFH
jgi:error-prone DNA polymerase